MSNPPTMVAEILFMDRDGGRSKVTLHFPFSISIAEAFPATVAIANAFLGISNAVVPQLNFRWNSSIDEPGEPDAESDCKAFASLFYSNGDPWEAITIPSPKPTLFEAFGPYAGIRVDVFFGGLELFLGGRGSVINDLVTLEGDPWPFPYIVGGKLL